MISNQTNNGVSMIGFGKSSSDVIVTNDDLSKLVETSDEWIYSRTGIKERTFARRNTSDLAYEAAINAINDAKIDRNSIDLIICATFTPDQITPSVANIVQRKLGIKQSTSFDLNAACTGFVYSLNVAKGLLLTNNYKRALVIGAENISKILDFNDRNTCVLFGDGAGCVILEKGSIGELKSIYTNTIPDIEDALYGGGINIEHPFHQEKISNNFGLNMKGQNVFKFAIKAITNSVNRVLELEGLSINDIDYIVPHQANFRIIEFVAKQLGCNIDKFYLNIEKYGNTSAASIPIALAEMKDKGLLNDSKKIILVGFGAGLTSGACYIDLNDKDK